jgi:hypothetical protein
MEDTKPKLTAEMSGYDIWEAFKNRDIPHSCPNCKAIWPYPFVLPGNVIGCLNCQSTWQLDQLKEQEKEAGKNP